MTTLAQIQRRVGVFPDGKWGPVTAAAVAKALGMGDPDPKALTNATAFFDRIRGPLFSGRLVDGQVKGCERLLDACGAAGFDFAWTAYVLATSAWETARQMQPVMEGYFLGNKKGDEHRRGLRYAPWWGRGDVQLTWERNYQRADKELGLGGALVLDPDMALRPDISAKVAITGMREGWFTGKRLADYLPSEGPASLPQFREARRIINGTDKANEIAVIALAFQDALSAGGWG